MKWRFLAGGAALLVASVCVPPPPPPPNVPCTAPPVAATYKIAFLTWSQFHCRVTWVPTPGSSALISNTGPCPTFYYLRVVGALRVTTTPCAVHRLPRQAPALDVNVRRGCHGRQRPGDAGALQSPRSGDPSRRHDHVGGAHASA